MPYWSRRTANPFLTLDDTVQRNRRPKVLTPIHQSPKSWRSIHKMFGFSGWGFADLILVAFFARSQRAPSAPTTPENNKKHSVGFMQTPQSNSDSYFSQSYLGNVFTSLDGMCLPVVVVFCGIVFCFVPFYLLILLCSFYIERFVVWFYSTFCNFLHEYGYFFSPFERYWPHIVSVILPIDGLWFIVCLTILIHGRKRRGRKPTISVSCVSHIHNALAWATIKQKLWQPVYRAEQIFPWVSEVMCHRDS